MTYLRINLEIIVLIVNPNLAQCLRTCKRCCLKIGLEIVVNVL